MHTMDWRHHGARPGGIARAARRDVERFLQSARALRLETQLRGEALWWPATAHDAADTLCAHFPDLLICLERLCAGEKVDSPLASFRLAPPTHRPAAAP